MLSWLRVSLERGTRKYSTYIILTISIGENLFQGCGIRSPQNSQHCELICLTIRGHTVVKSLQEDINFYLSAVLQFLKSAYNWLLECSDKTTERLSCVFSKDWFQRFLIKGSKILHWTANHFSVFCFPWVKVRKNIHCLVISHTVFLYVKFLQKCH